MVKLTPPTNAEAATAPREFALYMQLDPDHKGEVGASTLSELLKRCGDEHAAIKDHISFTEFCSMFARPTVTTAEGSGNTLGIAIHDPKGTLGPWKFGERS